MMWFAIAANAALYALSPAEEPSWPLMPPSPAALGSCLSEGGPVDLRRVMFLENRLLDTGAGGSAVRIELRRRTISFITLAGTPEETTRIQDVARIVSQDEQQEEPDIYLKLAVLDGDLLVYWRETYLYRSYRQGLFRIEGHDLVRFCEGNGGVAITH